MKKWFCRRPRCPLQISSDKVLEIMRREKEKRTKMERINERKFKFACSV